MVDRSRTWSQAKQRVAYFIAPAVILATVVGGVVGARALPALDRFAAERSIPGFSSADNTGDDNARSTRTSTQRSTSTPRTVPEPGSGQLWQWSGASPGAVRTVTLAIDPQIYPIDGLRWFLNGAHDRNDIHGPLDVNFGLWHATTRTLVSGDVVSACWVGRDGVERCPQVVVR